jgi:hypothetical protein
MAFEQVDLDPNMFVDRSPRPASSRRLPNHDTTLPVIAKPAERQALSAAFAAQVRRTTRVS